MENVNKFGKTIVWFATIILEFVLMVLSNMEIEIPIMFKKYMHMRFKFIVIYLLCSVILKNSSGRSQYIKA